MPAPTKMFGDGTTHKGAIAMSEIVLKYAKDPAIRNMAEKTKEMQQKEVKELEIWDS